jgi:micrococcal nuclease
LKSIFNFTGFFISLAVFNIFLALPLFSFAGQFKVVRVYDGDTIKVTENGDKITIRLVGIDAPEISKKKHLPGQPFCLKAKEYLSTLVLNKVVNIKFYGKDASGKSLGEIFAEKVNINIEMIHAGLAEVYKGMPAKNLEITTYRDAEKKAKEAVKGIWELRDQYFSPWDWREMHK